MPKVSVVLPVYNCRTYVREAVENVLRQSYRDMELIVVDDGSEDGTSDIVLQLAGCSTVRVVTHDENKGICESLNDGIKLSTGELIAIQHADDISLPGRIETQAAYLDLHPDIDLVAGWIRYVNRKGRKRRDDWWLKRIKTVPDDPEVIANTLLEMNVIPHPTVMMRRNVVDTTGLYDPEAFPTEDYDYWLRISETHRIGMVREVLCLYRRHRGQLTRTQKMQRIREKTVDAVQRAKRRRGMEQTGGTR